MAEHHKEEISRRNPTFFLFLVDQSGSMSNPWGQSTRPMAHGVSDAINRLIQGLVFRCSMGNEIVDRYYMGLIGYNSEINLGFGGDLQGQYQVPVSQVGNHPLRVDTRTKKEDDGAGGILTKEIKFPVWLDPVARGRTKMREALEIAKDSVADFVASFPDSYPPMVVNITDGIPTDSTKPKFPEAEEAALAIQSITNSNGSNALLFNIHISPKALQPILFPHEESQLPDVFSRLLFRMSSPLTDDMLFTSNAIESEIELQPGARGFVFQGDLISVIQLLDIGTRVADRNLGTDV